MLGKYPDDLTDTGPLNTGRGRVIPTTPFEGVWRPLAEWFGVEPSRMAEVPAHLATQRGQLLANFAIYLIATNKI